jgi:sulfide:quinone oxidoreductase
MSGAVPTRVLIAGGGVAALEAALALRALAGDLVAVELLAPDSHFVYRPLAVAEPFALGEPARLELAGLAARAGALLRPGVLVAVDADRHLAHTGDGAVLSYDALLVASGAEAAAAIPGALTFRGPPDVGKLTRLLDEAAAREVPQLAFVLPRGAGWPLPAYELALLTADFLSERGLRDVELSLVTPEAQPLELFGTAASRAVRALLEERRVALHTGAYVRDLVEGELRLLPEGTVPAARVVALPRLAGRRIHGLPQTQEGFVPVDPDGRVPGIPDVYAAGDVTTFPVKQGGIATQQADAAAETIAAAAGASITPEPFRPVLRGLLLTGRRPRFLHRELAGGAGNTSIATERPLWWPPAKIVGRHLAPFLADLSGGSIPEEQPDGAGAVAVAVEIEVPARGPRAVQARARGREPEDDRALAELTLAEPVVVGPRATLAEVAALLYEHDAASALVVEDGRLLGSLTARDIVRALARHVDVGQAGASGWMTAEPVYVGPETTLDEAALVMAELRLHELPVLDADGHPLGCVALHDVLRAARARTTVTGFGLGL